MRQPKLPTVYNLIALQTIDSTNNEAKRLAAMGEESSPDGTIVWAIEQTGGRGRRGRIWESPPGNLYCSLILRPEVGVAIAAQLSFVAALALYDALGNVGEPGHEVLCKWPNDVLLNGKKVAGILLESEAQANEELDWLVLGLGVNIVSHPEKTSFFPATSLRFESNDATVEDLLEAFCRSFLGWADKWLDQGFAPVRQNWLWRCKGKGEWVEVQIGNETVSGIFQDINEDGALLLATDGGTRVITAGDIFLP
jgi:BirA family biotin operon repressor/biotin-[acetyl-CoA-carboxylase] ligase